MARHDPITQLFQKEANSTQPAGTLAALLRPIWKFLNSAFGLWLLSSVIIAAFISLAAQAQRCYSTATSSVPQLAKSVSERDLRILAIHTALREPDQDELYSELNDIIDGSRFFYIDFKDFSFLDLEFRIFQLHFDLITLGLKNTPSDLGFASSIDLTYIIELSNLPQGEWEPIIAELKKQAMPTETINDILSKERSLTHFPFVTEKSASKFDVIFEEPPCQLFYLIRDRFKQYYSGLQ